MLETPITREIKTGYQRDTNLLHHVIESIRAIEGKKILVNELTDQKRTTGIMLTNLKQPRNLTKC